MNASTVSGVGTGPAPAGNGAQLPSLISRPRLDTPSTTSLSTSIGAASRTGSGAASTISKGMLWGSARGIARARPARAGRITA